jgi:type VI secretion protein, VC_A0107 family
MAENSIPPKERINIVYRTKTNNQEADVELPLKLMVVSNLTGENQTPLEDREVVSINKINFDQVMKSLDIHTEFSVKNRLNSGSEDLNIDLNFESIQDFSPDNIINQVPELKKLLQLRKALVALKGPMGNMPDFRKAVLEAIKDEYSRKQLLLELKDEKDKE